MMTSNGMFELKFSPETNEVLSKSSGYLTPEQAIRNFFWLYRRNIENEWWNVIGIDDDFMKPEKVSWAWVLDYYTVHKAALDKIGITELHMKQFFPYVQYNQATSPANWEASDKSRLQDISWDNQESKKRGRRASVEKSVKSE